MSRAQLNSVLRSSARQIFTATAGQTVFTISGGYVAGSIDVYVNGVKLFNGSDYIATNGTTVTLVNGCAENDTVDVVAGLTAMGGIGLVTRQSFTATDAQTVFTIAGGYQPNAIDVFKNGVKLQNGIDVDVSSGTTITITTGCVVNDIIDVSANQVTGQTGVTNLSFTRDATTLTVISDTGADAVLPAATTSLAGLMSAADKTTLGTFGTAATASSAQVCKAWVNFNGTGTVAIRDKYNVSSITDNGVGDYTVNFTSAMGNSSFACSAQVGATSLPSLGATRTGPKTTSSVRVWCTNSGEGALADPEFVELHVFSN